MEQRTSTTNSTTTFVLDANALISAFTSFLQFDVASGGASGETIRTYWCEAKQYLLWCEVNQLQPLAVTRDAIKIYRHYLVQQNYKPATISLKLVAVSRMYDAAMEYGLLITPSGGSKHLNNGAIRLTRLLI